MKISKERTTLIVAGAAVSVMAFILVLSGNPANMGFCIACFLRDIAGSLSLHSSANTQYMRPEIIGLMLGAFVISLVRGEFKPRCGSSPFIRFILGICVAIGALVFLGCPLRMVLRMAAGDFNAWVALIGFIAGIATGCLMLNLGFSLGRAGSASRIDASSPSFIMIVFFILLAFFPSVLKFSESGPGSMHAPVVVSLIAGLLVGALAQRSRLCFAGGIRDVILLKDTTLLTGFVTIFLVSLVINLVSGSFNPGFEGQPVAHTQWLWNILGMYVTGFASVLLGGCPLRQIILAGEGNVDSGFTVLGLIAGGAIAHNFNLASSTSGATAQGKAATLVIIVFLFLFSALVIYANKKKEAAL